MAVTPAPPVDLSRLNGASIAGFVAALDGIYEHSPWIAERAAAARPFATLAQLRQALVQAVRDA
ncbi:MAG: allantoate amidohydrolase, partial [Burkholderiaceae bacterium]|nr:allantoate amidohydrolase [Burkholderiaceae bacterium]